MYQGNRRESQYSDIGSEDGMLVNEPFTRDPGATLKKLNTRKYEMSPRPSIVSPVDDRRDSYCYSPTPYSKPNIGNLRDKFSAGGGMADNKVFKKRSAPKPPADGYNEQLEQRMSTKKGPAPLRPVSPYRAPKADPIREMESIGKKDV